MKNQKFLLLLVLAALCGLAGCATQQGFEPVNKICIDSLNKQQAVAIAEETLSKMSFSIEKSDVNKGLIRTRPLTGAQFFEFWRSDNAGAFNNMESNLHTLKRTVELNITEENNKMCIGCKVKVSRLSLPEKRVTSTAQAYELFSASKSSLQTFDLDDEQKSQMAWLDMGNDDQLATVILKRIEKQIAAAQKEGNL